MEERLISSALGDGFAVLARATVLTRSLFIFAYSSRVQGGTLESEGGGWWGPPSWLSDLGVIHLDGHQVFGRSHESSHPARTRNTHGKCCALKTVSVRLLATCCPVASALPVHASASLGVGKRNQKLRVYIALPLWASRKKTRAAIDATCKYIIQKWLGGRQSPTLPVPPVVPRYQVTVLLDHDSHHVPVILVI